MQLGEGTKDMELKITAEQAEHMVREADLDGDGFLSFHEFSKMMMETIENTKFFSQSNNPKHIQYGPVKNDKLKPINTQNQDLRSRFQLIKTVHSIRKVNRSTLHEV